MQTLLALPSCCLPLFQIKCSCELCHMKMTWFHENEWTNGIHLLLHKDSCQRGKSQLWIGLFIHELPQVAIYSKSTLNFSGWQIRLAWTWFFRRFYCSNSKRTISNWWAWHCHSEQQYQSHMTSNWPGIQIFWQSIAKVIRVYFRIVQQYESHMNTIICEHNSQVVFSLWVLKKFPNFEGMIQISL